MQRRIAIGIQDFTKIKERNAFYVDKTLFIKEWWESGDDVTMITRPRRFGKTLTMSMVEQFFSSAYKERADLFENTKIWKEKEIRRLQGTYPVITLTFSDIKETSYSSAWKKIRAVIADQYNKNYFLTKGELLNENEKKYFELITSDAEEYEVALSLRRLSEFLYRRYGKKVILLLDEYDTPMQEAYLEGYWDEMTAFVRSLFNASFKSNPYLEKAIMTGITRVSKESIFSDLNNLKVITTTSDEYASSFGFTEEEVFAALDEYGMSDQRENVKKWYDGFTFGKIKDIYNPWSILNFLDTGKLGAYWANTSSNSLVGKLIRESGKEIKENFESLMKGGQIHTKIDEQIVYSQLEVSESSIWSLLLAGGYLKAAQTEFDEVTGRTCYSLELTNKEVQVMFHGIIHEWFADYDCGYNDFIRALFADDIKAMNIYMNRVAMATISFFDSGNRSSAESEPERFYHGFVLGLLVEMGDRYVITSNRESGFGRYDVVMEPRDHDSPAYILEFKVRDADEEADLSETVKAALRQIDEKKYASDLIARGIPQEKIRKYGFAFQGKKVLIGR